MSLAQGRSHASADVDLSAHWYPDGVAVDFTALWYPDADKGALMIARVDPLAATKR